MASNIGRKRLVVGAHYGLKEWLAQRVTALVLGVYVIVVGLYAFFKRGLDYEAWSGLFAPLWFKVVTLLALAALFYHAWVGVRDIWMDYVKPAGLRLALEVLTVLWLLACAVWSVQILWRV
jgi:succinate dehydrogenase / fumarate reductase membrane anchor subunit